MTVRDREIQLRRTAQKCGKVQENCGAVTKPPKPQGQHLCTGDTQGANTHVRGTRKRQRRKIAGNCGTLRKIAKMADLNATPPPLPGVRTQQCAAVASTNTSPARWACGVCTDGLPLPIIFYNLAVVCRPKELWQPPPAKRRSPSVGCQLPSVKRIPPPMTAGHPQ